VSFNTQKTGTNGIPICICYNTRFPIRGLKPLRFVDIHMSNYTARFSGVSLLAIHSPLINVPLLFLETGRKRSMHTILKIANSTIV
jgi:hypothetical protein